MLYNGSCACSKHPVVINTFADSLTNCFWNLENVPLCTTPYMSTKHQCNAPLNVSTMPSSAINTLDNLRAMVLFLSSSGSACATLYCEMRASQRLTLYFFWIIIIIDRIVCSFLLAFSGLLLPLLLFFFFFLFYFCGFACVPSNVNLCLGCVSVSGERSKRNEEME